MIIFSDNHRQNTTGAFEVSCYDINKYLRVHGLTSRPCSSWHLSVFITFMGSNPNICCPCGSVSVVLSWYYIYSKANTCNKISHLAGITRLTYFIALCQSGSASNFPYCIAFCSNIPRIVLGFSQLAFSLSENCSQIQPISVKKRRHNLRVNPEKCFPIVEEGLTVKLRAVLSR